ncbi:MAG TPA: hypothetical protein PLA74_07315 [Syntrophales bacterium]|nr:hypothetical protein [Syntrophales bacterium]HPQ42860.1 hypothetical protein [Syntrophales bacterium]
MKTVKLVLLLFFLMGISGCSHVKEYIEIARDDVISDRYLDMLNRYTQEKTVYNAFETTIRIVSTWKNREFTNAYLSEYSRLYLLTGTDKEKRSEILSDASSDFREFLFYAYIPDRESNDFSKPESVWKIFSYDDGEERLEPLDIREINTTPLVTKLFPYVKPYGKFYSVKFPLHPPSNQVDTALGKGPKLIFTGVLGKIELQWSGIKKD